MNRKSGRGEGQNSSLTVNTNKTENLVIQVQHEFSFKKWDDATSGSETNHQVLASSLIAFSWKKREIENLASKSPLNGL